MVGVRYRNRQACFATNSSERDGRQTRSSFVPREKCVMDKEVFCLSMMYRRETRTIQKRCRVGAKSNVIYTT